MTHQSAHYLDTCLPEPHASRRRLVLQRHPKVRRLLAGHSPQLRWQLLAVVGVQLSGAFYGRQLSWAPLLLMAYAVGGVGAHVLWSLIHECSHDQLFGRQRRWLNQAAAIVANLPLVLPHATLFRRYHQLHHQHLGQPGLDPDMPSDWEVRLVGTSPARKLLYLLLQPLFYYTRPMLLQPLAPAPADVLNVAVQLAFNWCLVRVWGWPALGYLLASFVFAMGLHPIAAHFLSDHVRFQLGTRGGGGSSGAEHKQQKEGRLDEEEDEVTRVPQETFSYYGSLNQLINNEGYHSEHHDFPSMASSRLPQLSRMADSVYGRLQCHTSWIYTIYLFVTDRRVSLASRVRRPAATTGHH